MNPRDTIAEELPFSEAMSAENKLSYADDIMQALTAAGYTIVGPADMEAEDLDSRMKAAGMVPLSDLIAGNTPLERWMAHTGVRDLDTFEQWLTMRQREFMTMRVGYELGDKDQSDELYEWVFAHAAAFGEVAANFRAMKERSGASPHMPVPAGWQPIETAPEDKTSVIIAVPTKDMDDYVVGEAYFDPENYEGGDWWWAGTSHGDYSSDPVIEANYHPPSLWMPLPAAPKPAALTQEPKP